MGGFFDIKLTCWCQQVRATYSRLLPGFLWSAPPITDGAICAVQQAPIPHGWDLFSQKQVLCGRTATRGEPWQTSFLPAPSLSQRKHLPRVSASLQLWQAPFPRRWRGTPAVWRGGRQVATGGQRRASARPGTGAGRARGRRAPSERCRGLTACRGSPVSLGGCLLFPCRLTNDSC